MKFLVSKIYIYIVTVQLIFIIQIVFAAICFVALCNPVEVGKVKVYQDTAGNYDFQYNIPGSSRHELNKNGIVVGTYSYIDSNGILQTVHYTAGPQGYRILDGSSIYSTPYILSAPVRYVRDVEEAKSTAHSIEASPIHF